MEKNKKELAEKAIEIDRKIKEENYRILSTLFMTSCAAQIAVEGIDDLVGFSAFNKGTKNKMQNFQNFIMRELRDSVNLMYGLDEEMTQKLVQSLENMIKFGTEGVAKMEPVEIISRFYNLNDKS